MANGNQGLMDLLAGGNPLLDLGVGLLGGLLT